MNYQQLWAIANCTGVDAALTSPNPGDCSPIPAGVVTHTGGSGGNFIRVPGYWGSAGWPDNCIQVEGSGGSWTVFIWADNDQGQLLYWSGADNFDSAQLVSGSDTNMNWSLLIQVVNGNVSVGWNPF